MTAWVPISRAARASRAGASADDWLIRVCTGLLIGALALGTIFPLATFLVRSLVDKNWNFVGLGNFATYLASPALFQSIGNSLLVACLSTFLTVVIAFVFAYGLTRSCMWGKPILRTLALVPLLAPSLLPAISMIYLFGNNGLIKGMLLGHSIYGPIGIVLGEVVMAFPHALMILTTALSLADARLYEASVSMRASRLRTFRTVTLPAVKYGLISCIFVVFTMTVTDFGVPKVIGGNFNVLATDVYKQVVGWQNFEMGAVTGVILLLPAVLSFAIDALVRKRQIAVLSSNSVPYEPKPNLHFDLAMFAFCAAVSAFLLLILGVAVFASLVKFWPYNLSLTLANYDFDHTTDVGWKAYWNSFRMAAYSAVIGTAIVFVGAYLVEKTNGMHVARTFIHFMAMLPMAVPGIVLGLCYIFFFNHPQNPLNFLYGTISILVVNCVFHFYTVGHLTAVTALRQLDKEFEAVSASLKVPIYRTFMAVTVPICLPAILSISIYIFVNAMTTVSAVVFLYTPHTLVASVSVLYLDDNGAAAPAAAMAVMIVVTSLAVRLLHWLLTKGIENRTQRWRRLRVQEPG